MRNTEIQMRIQRSSIGQLTRYLPATTVLHILLIPRWEFFTSAEYLYVSSYTIYMDQNQSFVKVIISIDSDYPLPYIITDATTTLLAILTMFALLRMECTQVHTIGIITIKNKSYGWDQLKYLILKRFICFKILAEAEEMWQQPAVPARWPTTLNHHQCLCHHQ